jgi:hypothetical protein
MVAYDMAELEAKQTGTQGKAQAKKKPRRG